MLTLTSTTVDVGKAREKGRERVEQYNGTLWGTAQCSVTCMTVRWRSTVSARGPSGALGGGCFNQYGPFGSHRGPIIF